MTYYYVDPTATGANDGGGDGAAGDPTDSANWTDAYLTLQQAATVAAAGDTIYCKGEEVITAAVLFPNSGTVTSRIRCIGVGSDGLESFATRYKLDAIGEACHGLDLDGAYTELRNFELVSDTTSYNAITGTSASIQLYNMNVLGWQIGMTLDGGTFSFFDNLHISGTSSYGISGTAGNITYSRIHGTGGHGIYTGNANTVVLMNSIVYDCAGSGWRVYEHGKCYNSVFHGNSGSGVVVDYDSFMGKCCRFTENGSYGVGGPDNDKYLQDCFFAGNGTAEIQGNYVDLGRNVFGVASGYVNPDEGNFNLRADATGRNIPIVLP